MLSSSNPRDFLGRDLEIMHLPLGVTAALNKIAIQEEAMVL